MVPDDTLPARQELVDISQALTDGAHDRVTVHTGARVQSLSPDGDRIRVRLTAPAAPQDVLADHVVSLTGHTGDQTLYRQLQVHECYATGAPMNLSAALLAASGASADCLAQPAPGIDQLRNPEPDFFILGAKSYGRLNTFLLRSGYQQVDEIVAAYAGSEGVPAAEESTPDDSLEAFTMSDPGATPTVSAVSCPLRMIQIPSGIAPCRKAVSPGRS